MKPRLLVFPIDLDDCIPLLQATASLGIDTIGASSAMSSPKNREVNKFIKLPYITAPSFDDALAAALKDLAITSIYAPHQGVWRHLSILQKTDPERFNFELCQPDPFSATCQLFAPHGKWAQATYASRMAEGIGGQICRAPLGKSYYSALHRQFLSIPGQCDEDKLSALADIARVLPPGDLLEVGSLYGRSAFALGYLASRHQIGNLICIDPWNSREISDQGKDAAVLNIDNDNIDFEQIHRIFLSAAALLDNIGYIRNTSEKAHSVYAAAREKGMLGSPELEKISLMSHLSLIHIDGNHRYDLVQKDVDIWTPYLIPGGWLLLDDYLWAFGDGPRRVGDALLGSPLFDRAFVGSDTLFLRRSSEPLPSNVAFRVTTS